MDADAVPLSQPRSKPRRWRFRAAMSLRTLMVLVLISGCWMAWKVKQVRVTRRAIAMIQDVGGSVRFSDDPGEWREKSRFAPPKWLVKAMGKEFFFDVASVGLYSPRRYWDDTKTRTLAAFPALRRINLSGVALNEVLIEQLIKLPELREISLHEATVGHYRSPEARDFGIGRLGTLKKLRKLSLYKGRMTANDLKALAKLPDLRELDFHVNVIEEQIAKLDQLHRVESPSSLGPHLGGGRRFSSRLLVEAWKNLERLHIISYDLNDDEMKAIASLSKLEDLSLVDTETEDKHLELFAGMKSLKTLNLESCDVTPEGINALSQRLSSVSIKGPSMRKTKSSAR